MGTANLRLEYDTRLGADTDKVGQPVVGKQKEAQVATIQKATSGAEWSDKEPHAAVDTHDAQ